MKHLMIFLASFLLLVASESFGQQLSYSFSFEQQDDPAYKLYKDGYNLVLEAKWKEAQKKFEEVLKLYPNSSYRDDASYWSAYCLKYQDWKKAIDALKKFLKDFPKSSYRGDALEDLAELQVRIQKNMIVLRDSLHKKLRVEIPDIEIEVPDIRVEEDWDWDFPFGDRVVVRIYTDEMQDEMDWGFGSRFRSGREKNLDENTRLKLSAIRGISADRDSESFRTVRDILLDRNENARLREEALRIISRYQKFDILPTLKDVAKNDPERRLRHGAIYYIGKFEKDKDAATGVLIELYTATPKDSTQLKERLLYSIARTRTEKGMDFLVNIAKSAEDSKLRESALYWLGKYGEGKKKKALYEILKKK